MKFVESSQVDRIGVYTVGSLFQKCGYIFREQPIVDCGIDAQIEVVDGNSASGKLVALQIKSGDSWFKETTPEGFIFRGERKHLQYWLNHSLPVVIVLCDTESGIAYWQSIDKHALTYTGKGWKITIPYQQQVNAGMHTDLLRLVNQIQILPDYTITQISDNSHGAAKRYSARITLSKEHSQAELLQIIRILTEEIKLCEYHRSDHTRVSWRNVPAHVVWLFIYPSPQDERNNNYLCKSEWIDDSLEEQFRPHTQNGQDIGNGINVDWSNSYLEVTRYNQQNEIPKESFIQYVEGLTTRTVELYQKFVEKLNQYLDATLSFQELCEFITGHRKQANDIYQEGIFIGLSSYECKDASIKFQSMISHLDNIFMLLGDREESNAIFNLKHQAEFFVEAYNGLVYELKKIA